MINPRGLVPRWRSALLHLALLAVSSGIALALAEAVPRLVFRHITTTDDNYSYFARRWRDSHAGEFDADGFRTRPYSEFPSKGVTRIAVIGDSFTFGSGIEIGDRVTNLIEEELNARGTQSFEVLNFGKTGQETEDEIETLQTVLARAHPHFVLLQWFVNDVEARPKRRPEPWPLLPSARVDYFLKARSALYFLLNRGWLQLQLNRGWVQTYEDYMRERFMDPRAPVSIEATRTFATLLTMPRAAGVEVGGFLYPQLEAVGGDPGRFPNEFLLERTLATCHALDVRCVDLRGPLAQLRPPERRWVNQFDHHPSAEANRVAAVAVLAAFEQEWLALAAANADIESARLDVGAEGRPELAQQTRVTTIVHEL
jgi:hypothetical protein